MKTTIITTVQEWIPESEQWFEELFREQDAVSDYSVLKKLAEVCIEYFKSTNVADTDTANEIIKVVSMLYQSSNQYTRNAIENEFLRKLSMDESPASLKKHLTFLPIELRKEYIKTILEN
ncbi:MAG: hypothetical protein KF704_05355 [Crocinitomicaceae bacterium]|nr:hypothetical protein [Crocinitomicaceae bacterium]NGF75656.1 hypothetical protein [Fluviicola sp. SGL-29]